MEHLEEQKPELSSTDKVCGSEWRQAHNVLGVVILQEIWLVFKLCLVSGKDINYKIFFSYLISNVI